MAKHIHIHAPVRDHWTTHTRLGGGYTIAEGAGTNGGEWALILRGSILFRADKRETVQREYEMAFAD